MRTRLVWWTALPLLAGIALAAQTGPTANPAPAAGATGTPVAEAVPAQDVAVIKITPYKPTIQRDPFATPRDDRPADAPEGSIAEFAASMTGKKPKNVPRLP